MTVSFSVNANDSVTIGRIVDRAVALYSQHNSKADRMALEMDMTACHANGCRLDLTGLLAADDFNFLHDVGGISRKIDRDTGRLTDCFRPRFAE